VRAPVRPYALVAGLAAAFAALMLPVDGLAVALGAVAAVTERIGAAGRRAARWLGGAWALVLATTGLGMAAVALFATDAVRAGELSGPMLALLVLIPLAMADVAAAVRDTVQTRTSPVSSDAALVAARARWQPHAPLTSPATLDLGPGERIASGRRLGDGQEHGGRAAAAVPGPGRGDRHHGGVPWITHGHVGLDLVDHVVNLGEGVTTGPRSLLPGPGARGPHRRADGGWD